MNYRLESDSVGEKQVPMDAYYGVQTLRAFENFNITGRKQPAVIVESLAEIKKACGHRQQAVGSGKRKGIAADCQRSRR